MNKFDRVISTLVLLQTRKVISAQSIADRFEVSLRTVYRDIKSLKNAGIPIIGDPGIGYSVMAGYRFPPVTFNEAEATALLTADKFIGTLTDDQTAANYSNAMIKIKAILRSSEKQSLAVLDDSIVFIDKKKWKNKTYLQDLFASIASKQILSIDYEKADGTITSRKLEPIGCYHQSNNWYLIAYCLLQKDYRTFKMNRILALQVLDQHFDTKHESLQNFVRQQNESWKKKKQQFHTIEIVFSPSLLAFAERRKYYFGFVEQRLESGATYMKFLNPSLEYFARWLLQFGDQATVLSPKELKERLCVLSAELYHHYQ